MNGISRHFIALLFLPFLFVGCDKDCVEEECNGYHTARWDPVCGCNGETYQNAEMAECYGIDDYSPGECDE